MPEIEKIIDDMRAQVDVRVYGSGQSPMGYLYRSKSPAYRKRFGAWARSAYGEHFINLINALLSGIATQFTTDTRIDSPYINAYWRGYSAGLRDLEDKLRAKSGMTNEELQDDK